MPYRINENDCEENDISIGREQWCNHCGTLEPHSPTWCDGDTWWCFGCAAAGIMWDLTENEIEEIVLTAKVEYRKHLIRELKRIDEQQG